MKKYEFLEHGVGYRLGKTLQPYRPQYKTIVSWLKSGSTVLDVGCGDGVLGKKMIQEKKCKVYGIDLDPIGVKQAQKQGVVAKIWDADSGLPYRAKSFDVVICNEVLEFLQNPNFVVSEILRVGKKAIIEFPNFGFWFYRLQLIFGRFPQFALYGHSWWNTSQIKFFSYADFFRLPAIKKTKILRVCCINWRNREVSFMGKFFPNLFARSCIVELLCG